MRLPPLKSLQTFRYAANELSFKGAAQKLNISPAAVSTQIRSLETFMGFKLFERLTREVRLTHEGRELFRYVDSGFRELEKGVAIFSEDPNPYRLTVATVPSFATRWLVPRLEAFQVHYPKMILSLVPSLQLSNFQEDGIDIAIRFGEGNYPNLKSKKLMEEVLVPVCHPSLSIPSDLSSERLKDLPWLIDGSDDVQESWQWFQEAIGVEIPEESIRFKVTEASALVEAVVSGQGVALLHYSLVYELLDSGLLCCPINVSVRSRFSYYVVATEAKFRARKVKVFVDWISAEAKKMRRKQVTMT